MADEKISFFLGENFISELKPLPWEKDLEDWDENGYKFINFRKGISRHTVRFIRIKNSYAIKQTTAQLAKIETENYKKLLAFGIHALTPAGYVVHHKKPIKVKTKAGSFYEKDENAFVITILDQKSLPDSHLYKYEFSKKNRQAIWDAAAGLFADIHFNNIYWGDASLSNMLIRFFKEKDELGRVRTRLKALLADAETVTFIPELSYKLRKEELNFFFESMNWLNHDFKRAGLTRTNFSTRDDKRYIIKEYTSRYKLLKALDIFRKRSGIDVKKYFQSLSDAGALSAIRKQINEHKWYLSERAGKEISFKEASAFWLNDIYIPILDEFKKLKVYKFFPFQTASSLYVDIMKHKYYMSQFNGMDVGIKNAVIDYSKKFADDKSFLSLITSKLKLLQKLFYQEDGPKKIT